MKPFTPKQQKAIDFAMRQDASLVLARPGSGKTRIALELIQNTDARRVLIIAPLYPASTSWPTENETWGYNYNMRLLHGKEKRIGTEDVTVINPEGLQWLREHASFKDYDFFIYDEIHKFKNAGSQRFRKWRKYMDVPQFRLGLTGTPTPDKLEGLWGQAYCIDGGAALGETKTQFKQTYFTPPAHYRYGDWIPNEGAFDEIMDKIKPFTIALDFDTELLTGLTMHQVKIPLSVEARQVYLQMKTEGVVEATDIIATNAAVKSFKLKQIASGNVYAQPAVMVDKNGNPKLVPVPVSLHTHKLEYLADLIDSLQGDPLLMFYEYQHDRDAIVNFLKGNVEVIDGSTSPAEMQAITKRWNDGKIPVLLGQVMKAGIGGNMQFGGANICFFSMPWAVDVLEQCIGRLHGRLGQQRDVMVHCLCCENTIDEDILQKLNDKKKLQDSMFQKLTR